LFLQGYHKLLIPQALTDLKIEDNFIELLIH
jgi:hypothetical protein